MCLSSPAEVGSWGFSVSTPPLSAHNGGRALQPQSRGSGPPFVHTLQRKGANGWADMGGAAKPASPGRVGTAWRGRARLLSLPHAHPSASCRNHRAVTGRTGCPAHAELWPWRRPAGWRQPQATGNVPASGSRGPVKVPSPAGCEGCAHHAGVGGPAQWVRQGPRLPSVSGGSAASRPQPSLRFHSPPPV